MSNSTKNFQQTKVFYNISEKIRYKNGLICPHCSSTQQVGLRTDQPKLCNCNHCHNTFYIFTGTIFEKSSTDLKKWFFAVHLVLNV
ncbi:transposase, partial [Treponema sp.]|uniref:transposase n=1 Tax=Treponema sp. TaxID=166 RepID=UPI00338FEE98